MLKDMEAVLRATQSPQNVMRSHDNSEINKDTALSVRLTEKKISSNTKRMLDQRVVESSLGDRLLDRSGPCHGGGGAIHCSQPEWIHPGSIMLLLLRLRDN